jgi:hypothetical protein
LKRAGRFLRAAGLILQRVILPGFIWPGQRLSDGLLDVLASPYSAQGIEANRVPFRPESKMKMLIAINLNISRRQQYVLYKNPKSIENASVSERGRHLRKKIRRI